MVEVSEEEKIIGYFGLTIVFFLGLTINNWQTCVLVLGFAIFLRG